MLSVYTNIVSAIVKGHDSVLRLVIVVAVFVCRVIVRSEDLGGKSSPAENFSEL